MDMTVKRRFFLLLSGLVFGNKALAASQPQPAQASGSRLPRSMSFRAARATLAVPRNASSWDRYIVQDQHIDEFLWTADGDPVERWNALFAGKNGAGRVDFTVEGKKEHFYLAYGGRKVQVPVKHDRDDAMAVMVTLNNLVKSVAEIRFCVDSCHSSDLAFLAMPPGEWAALEAESGPEAVAYRFMALPDTMAKFWPRYRKTTDEVRARVYNRAV
jgi:hypothetical protein